MWAPDIRTFFMLYYVYSQQQEHVVQEVFLRIDLRRERSILGINTDVQQIVLAED